MFRFLYYLMGWRKAQYEGKSEKPAWGKWTHGLTVPGSQGADREGPDCWTVGGLLPRGRCFIDETNSSLLGCWTHFWGTPGTPHGGIQVVFQHVPFSSSPTAADVLNVLIEKVIFGDILGVNRTLDNKFSPHGSPVDYFNQIYEVLFSFETSHKLSVIWRPGGHKREITTLRTFNNCLLKPC